MRLKIVSDGTTIGTKLYDAETGEEISGAGVVAVEWRISAREVRATAVIHLKQVEVEVEGDAERIPA